MTEQRLVWIPVGGDCNCRCGRCRAGDGRAVTADAVYRRASRGRPAPVVLGGPGEPTLRPDLDELVYAARRGGAARIALVTNGRALAYPRVAAQLARLRLDAIVVTLHAARAAEHDRLARAPGAFAQTVAGIRNGRRAARSTRWWLRVDPRVASPASLDELRALARAAGLDGVWLDGRAGGGWSAPPPAARGTVLDDAELERRLLDPPPAPRELDGAAPARFHPGEGAVSLVVRTGCANACVFCTTRLVQQSGHAHWPLDDLRGFDDALADGRRRGLDALRMVAIEPLEHPDLPRLLRRARRLGYSRVEAWTSGRALADEGWADELAAAGLTHVDVPLLGVTAEVHDAVARAPGSFEETVAGLGHAVARFQVRHHLIVVRDNLAQLGPLLTFGRRWRLGPPASLLVPAPSLPESAHYAAFAMRFEDGAAALAALPADEARLALERGLARHLPPCVLARTPGLSLDGVQWPTPAPRDGVRDGSLDQPGAAAKLRAPCPHAPRCPAAARCPGVHPAYRAVFGDGALDPGAVDGEAPDDRR